MGVRTAADVAVIVITIVVVVRMKLHSLSNRFIELKSTKKLLVFEIKVFALAHGAEQFHVHSLVISDLRRIVKMYGQQ